MNTFCCLSFLETEVEIAEEGDEHYAGHGMAEVCALFWFYVFGCRLSWVCVRISLGAEEKMKMLVVGGMLVRTCVPLSCLRKRQRKRSCLSFYFFYCALEVCFCCALACLFLFLPLSL